MSDETIATERLALCNRALDLVGQGTHITSLTESSKEADLCSRLLDVTLKRAYDKFDWSFCRKDEIITSDYEVDVASRPFEYTYTMPSDVMRVLWLSSIDTNGATDRRFNAEKHVHFDFRNVEDEKCIVTDIEAPFLMKYQTDNPSFTLLPPSFIEGIEFLLASRLSVALVKGVNGLQMAQQLQQMGLQTLTTAHDCDVVIDPEPLPPFKSSFISSRS